jgi:hypothetical protein
MLGDPIADVDDELPAVGPRERYLLYRLRYVVPFPVVRIGTLVLAGGYLGVRIASNDALWLVIGAAVGVGWTLLLPGWVRGPLGRRRQALEQLRWSVLAERRRRRLGDKRWNEVCTLYARRLEAEIRLRRRFLPFTLPRVHGMRITSEPATTYQSR